MHLSISHTATYINTQLGRHSFTLHFYAREQIEASIIFLTFRYLYINLLRINLKSIKQANFSDRKFHSIHKHNFNLKITCIPKTSVLNG